MILRRHQLRSHGGYSDVYEELDHIHIAPRRALSSYHGSTPASSVFVAVAELEEHPDIWAAISTVWTNRHTYPTSAAFVSAINAALTAAGYTGPWGAAL